MAENDFRIGIPGGTATTLATTPITALNITKTPQKGPPPRSPISFIQPGEPSINGVDILTGPSVLPKFLWTINCLLTSTQSRQLTRLFNWQQSTYGAQNDGRLRLIDETRFIDDYERQVHSRTLLAQFDEADNAAQKYGYGVFYVMLILDSDFLQASGRLLGDDTDQLTFSIREVG
jgi:hypothetical protein